MHNVYIYPNSSNSVLKKFINVNYTSTKTIKQNKTKQTYLSPSAVQIISRSSLRSWAPKLFLQPYLPLLSSMHSFNKHSQTLAVRKAQCEALGESEERESLSSGNSLPSLGAERTPTLTNTVDPRGSVSLKGEESGYIFTLNFKLESFRFNFF